MSASLAPSKKPRSDSVLKNLPLDLQAEIYRRCRAASYDDVRKWLRKEKKIKTSTNGLSKFFGWFPLQARLDSIPAFAERLRKELAELGSINATAAQLSDLTLAAFEMQAMQDRDAELFVELRNLRIKAQQNALQDRRVKLLEEEATKAREVVGNEKLSPAEKEARLRAIFGLAA